MTDAEDVGRLRLQPKTGFSDLPLEDHVTVCAGRCYGSQYKGAENEAHSSGDVDPVLEKRKNGADEAGDDHADDQDELEGLGANNLRAFDGVVVEPRKGPHHHYGRHQSTHEHAQAAREEGQPQHCCRTQAEPGSTGLSKNAQRDEAEHGCQSHTTEKRGALGITRLPQQRPDQGQSQGRRDLRPAAWKRQSSRSRISYKERNHT